jgi:hypothetical protein
VGPRGPPAPRVVTSDADEAVTGWAVAVCAGRSHAWGVAPGALRLGFSGVSAYRRLTVALAAAGRRTPCQAAIGSLLGGDVNVLSVALLCVAGLIDGVLGRDWRLTQQVHRQAELLLAEVPVFAE